MGKFNVDDAKQLAVAEFFEEIKNNRKYVDQNGIWDGALVVAVNKCAVALYSRMKLEGWKP